MTPTHPVVESDELVAAATGTERKKLFGGLAAAVFLVGGSHYAYDALIGSKHVSTD